MKMTAEKAPAKEEKTVSKFFGRKEAGPVNITKSCYTMATVDDGGTEAEITMYGDIVEQQPVDWWSGEPVDGQYIIESEFLEDLKAVEGMKTVTIRMDSLGGDAGVAILIHNRLRELAAKGVSLVCIVDGVAMSGGSLIMCACDTVRVNPSSLIMIHKCWTFLFGGYNADEMREMAASNDAWDKAQASIYERKTGLSEAAVTSMMSDTTYMTGKEAVDKGFADELLDDAEPLDIAASADGRCLFVRGREMHLAPGMLLPDNIPTVESGAKPPVKANKKQPASTGSTEGGTLMAKTLEELRKEDPDLAAQFETEAKAAAAADVGTTAKAAEAERKRLSEIDDIAALYDDETVHEAKYGEHPCTAQEMAFRAAQSAVKNGTTFMAAANADYQASGVSKVGAAPTGDESGAKKTSEQRLTEARTNVKALLGKKEEK